MQRFSSRSGIAHLLLIGSGQFLVTLALVGVLVVSSGPAHSSIATTTAGGSKSTVVASQMPRPDADGADLAQVTVRPDAPKRVFEEKEDKPWTLLLGKAMLPATVGLGAFVVIWYVMKVTRTRYRRP